MIAGADISFASPLGAAVALAVVLPILAAAVVERRGARVRRILGLGAPGGQPFLAPLAAVVVVAALVALAAAQPLLATTERHSVRADLEVYLVLDTSRSMSAASSRSGPTRFDRAEAAAVEIHERLRGVPVGLASLTDRLLPHLFPTTDDAVFLATLRRALGVELPPPRSTSLHATSFVSLADAVVWNFFSETADRRVLVVLTDGEGKRDDARALRESLIDQKRVDVAFVHFSRRDERVYGPEGPERAYRPRPGSRDLIEGVARVVRGAVFDEEDVARVPSWIEQRTVARREAAETVPAPPRRLAPYALAATFVPLSFLLWRRNRA